eukprot:TRINITY_DN10794_c0_g1_i1.p1 TRINITY_DN10794_c0_g1~~TRINITY_DN10794_c0_g1_i1.p1  ORF type:complete len:459 (-),score=130.26 TRINITY_DN10794_c0_g1_i1:499-1875(-)
MAGAVMEISIIIGERVVTFDVDPDCQVEVVKAMLEAETQTPSPQQHLFFSGVELRDAQLLSDARVQPGDLLELRVAQPAPPQGARQGQTSAQDLLSLAQNPTALLQHLRRPEILPQLQRMNPQLGQAVVEGNMPLIQSFLQALQGGMRQQVAEEEAIDPMDPEGQRKIEEEIKKRNISEAEALAFEFNPAQFTAVTMLYVMMEVNNISISAFIDSGAQMSIMSQACAERCGVMRLCDERYKGFAMGVGKDRIIGRIHNVQLKIGPNFYMCGITVLETAKLDFIFGLDMLKRHQCSIDLKDNVLRIGTDDCAVPFIREHEIPVESHAEEPQEMEEGGAAAGDAGPSTSSAPASGSVPPKEPSSSGAATSQALPQEAQPNRTAGSNPTPPAPSPNVAPPSALSGQPVGGGGSTVPTPQSAAEAKVARLVELGFDRRAALEALEMCNGNEEQAAGFLFGGF